MLVAVLLAFGASLFQGFAPIDDSFLIVENLAIRGINPLTLRLAFTTYDPELYIPLTLVSYQINYVLGGLNPFGYHLFNLLLHWGNAVLLWWMLCKLIAIVGFEKSGPGSGPGRSSIRVSFACALLFAIHPLHTEAVVWLAGRKDLLSTFFALLSFGLYISYRNRRSGPEPGPVSPLLFLSVTMFLLALLSKVTPITLIAVIILMDMLIERRVINRSFFLDKVPYVAIGIIFAIVATGGKERILSDFSLFDATLMASKSSLFYLQKFLWPSGLALVYPQTSPITLTDPSFALTLTLTAILTLIALWQWCKRPWLTWSILTYFIILSPTFLHSEKGGLLFFAVDRYAYLLSLPVFFIIAYAFLAFLQRYKISFDKAQDKLDTRYRMGVVSCLLFLVSSLIAISRYQVEIWNSPNTLFERSIELYPETIMGRTALSRIEREQGRYEQAFETLREGLQYGDHAHLRLGAGMIYAKTGQIADAREQFLKSRELDPDFAEAVFSLGSLEEQLGNTAEAQRLYEQAVEMDGSYVVARVRLGRIYLDEGLYDLAWHQFEQALIWNQSSTDAHQGMIDLAEEIGDPGLERTHREALLMIDPK